MKLKLLAGCAVALVSESCTLLVDQSVNGGVAAPCEVAADCLPGYVCDEGRCAVDERPIQGTGGPVGPAGGLVWGPDGVWLEIPQGALATTLKVEIHKGTATIPLPDVELVTTTYRVVPEETALLSEARLNIPLWSGGCTVTEPCQVYARAYPSDTWSALSSQLATEKDPAEVSAGILAFGQFAVGRRAAPRPDAGRDASAPDTAVDGAAPDALPPDGTVEDGGLDAGPGDAGPGDAAPGDVSPVDLSQPDTSSRDAAQPDAAAADAARTDAAVFCTEDGMCPAGRCLLSRLSCVGCLSTLDCPGQHGCIDNTCVNLACEEHGDCGATQRCDPFTDTCVDNSCVFDRDCDFEPGWRCDTATHLCRDFSCLGDDTCDREAGERCLPGEQVNVCQVPEGCIDDFDCPDGSACIVDTCVGDYCFGLDECPAGFRCDLQRNQCVDSSCATDADCGGEVTLWCNPLTLQCEDRTCQEDADCYTAQGQRCVEMFSDKICVTSPECVSDATCPTGFVCLVGQCMRQQPCFDNSECQLAEVCDLVFHLCRDNSCFHDRDCGDRPWLKCVNMQCEDKSCDTDQQCDLGHNEYCYDATPVDICAVREDCRHNNECTVGDFCLLGKCTPLIFCQQQLDCPSPMLCYAAAGVCIEL